MYNTSGSTRPYYCCTTSTSEHKSCSVVRAHMKPFRQLVVVLTSGQLLALVHGQNIWSCLQQVIWSLICLTTRAWVYLATSQTAHRGYHMLSDYPTQQWDKRVLSGVAMYDCCHIFCEFTSQWGNTKPDVSLVVIQLPSCKIYCFSNTSVDTKILPRFDRVAPVFFRAKMYWRTSIIILNGITGIAETVYLTCLSQLRSPHFKLPSYVVGCFGNMYVQ